MALPDLVHLSPLLVGLYLFAAVRRAREAAGIDYRNISGSKKESEWFLRAAETLVKRNPYTR